MLQNAPVVPPAPHVAHQRPRDPPLSLQPHKRRLYLPDSPSVAKMHDMFIILIPPEQFPERQFHDLLEMIAQRERFSIILTRLQRGIRLLLGQFLLLLLLRIIMLRGGGGGGSAHSSLHQRRLHLALQLLPHGRLRPAPPSLALLVAF